MMGIADPLPHYLQCVPEEHRHDGHSGPAAEGKADTKDNKEHIQGGCKPELQHLKN